MSTTETWTVGKLLNWTTEFLRKNGSPSPRLDAEVLLAHARGCQRIELYTSFDDEPSEEIRTAFREMVKRRSEGSPVAYLVGHKEFYATHFEVNPDVLIPRPETEHLVVEALDLAKELTAKPLRIADVGTGSGCVAIILAKQLPHSHLTAIDISPGALETARRNAVSHSIDESQICFVEGDLLSACEPEQQFELIVSNPPYVSDAEYAELDKSVRDYEPKSALVSSPSGAEIIQRLIGQSAQHLVSGGWLIFEFSPMLAERLNEFGGPEWEEPRLMKDLAGHPRVVSLRRGPTR
ncbi:MAG: peptide chain release factor N(5)-glutamine methyltransferase [Pirellulaceae bacterium]